MVLTWKPYKGTESVFWESYKKEGDRSVITALSDENGWLRTDVTFNHGGFEYKGKSVPKKDGKGNWHFVERKVSMGDKDPEQVAHEAVNKQYEQKDADRQARIDKAHQENLEVQKRQAQALENIAETVAAILKEVRHLAEAVDDDGDLHIYKLHRDGGADKF